MEKKEQEQSCWVLSDSSYCNARHRADKRKEYALSIRLPFEASIAIHPLFAPTDGGTTIHITATRPEWETTELKNNHAKIPAHLFLFPVVH